MVHLQQLKPRAPSAQSACGALVVALQHAWSARRRRLWLVLSLGVDACVCQEVKAPHPLALAALRVSTTPTVARFRSGRWWVVCCNGGDGALR